MSAAKSASETLATKELSNTHVIRCHVIWITCLIVSPFGEGSSSLMEARDGSLESVSKTLSIRPHLFLGYTVPLLLRLRYNKNMLLILRLHYN